MNRKNTYSLNARGETVDKYGRVFEMDTKALDKRRRPMRGDPLQTRGPDVYPAPNSMEIKCK